MNTSNRFTLKIFRRLYIPALVSAIAWACADIADAVVIGQRMGTIGLATMTLILPVFMIHCLFAHGLGIGGSISYSTLLAEGKPNEAIDNFNHTVHAALGLCLLIAVFGNLFMTPLLALLGTVPSDGPLFETTRSYLRIMLCTSPFFFLSNIFIYYLYANDKAKLAGWASIVGNLLDICLSIVFVLILNMGVKGAVLSSALGQMIAICICLPAITKRSHTLRFKRVCPSLRYTARIFIEGFSDSVTYLLQLVFFLFCNHILIRMGDQTRIAAFNVVLQAGYVITYGYTAANRAMQPIVSTYHGEHREREKHVARRIALRYGYAAGLALACLIFLLPQSFCALFGITEGNALTLGISGLRPYCIGAIFMGISLLSTGYFQACGREQSSLLIAVLRGGGVLIPVTLLFSAIDERAFWWLFPVTEVVSLAIWSLVLRKKKDEQFDPKRLWNGSVHSSKDDIVVLTAGAKALCTKWGADSTQTYFVAMAIEETCLAILHNGFPTGGECLIELVLVAEMDGTFKLYIRDNAVHFNPFALETNKVAKGGTFDMDAMGMLVIKHKAKTFFYRQYGGFNTLVVTI